MATLRIPAEGRTVTEPREIARELAAIGIDYEPIDVSAEVAATPTPRLLAALEGPIGEIAARGSYATADVVDVGPETPGLDAMLARFSREHWHEDDEVRLVVNGSGLFHVRPESGRVVAIEVVAGDLIRVPAGTLHWFDLCATRTIRAVRLFRDPAGWSPRYTESGTERGFQPVCLGPPSPPPS